MAWFQATRFPKKSWKVKTARLKRSLSGADLVTKEQYDNFELGSVADLARRQQRRHVPCENFEEAWHTGPEWVLDDDKHADGKDPKTAGSLYALIAPTNKSSSR